MNNNTIIFFDYYHPYAGLCNQLYLTANHIVEAIQQNTKIYINKVNIDIFKKERIPACEFYDLEKTNENIKKLIGKDILLFEKPINNFKIPKLCIYPLSSIEILNCFEFQERFTSLVPECEYNGIHFRMELDVLIHYLFERESYDKFMELCNKGSVKHTFGERFVKLPDVKKYINFLLNQYFKFITHFGFEKPWFISTLIGKKEVHDALLPTLKCLTGFIEFNGGTWFASKQHFQQRELNALVDLLTLRESKKMIGFEGSSYSEGYCYKVNSIRSSFDKNNYLFVQGIVPKVNYEIKSEAYKN
jgi:hypothetical protein